MKKWLRGIQLWLQEIRHNMLESVTRWLVVQLIRLERRVRRTRLLRAMPPVVEIDMPEGENVLEGRYPWHER